MPSTTSRTRDPRSRIWQPLDSTTREIRLFVLEPSEYGLAPLKGRLITRSLEQHLTYDAISHAWGGPSCPLPILINNIEWLVTESVFEALTRLRDRTFEKCVWIDALCINQHDLNDRAEQVKLMEFIFHRASSVQAWLGRGPKSVDRLVRDMSAPGGLRSNYFARQQVTHGGEQTARNSLVEFARLEYWTRIWIVPEIFLARNVCFLYYQQTFTPENLLAMWKQCRSEANSDFDNAERSLIGKRLRPVTFALQLQRRGVAIAGDSEQNSFDLSSLLSQTRMSQCSDKRDRIYGIMGIITAMFGLDFMTISYEKSAADVYTEFTRNLITRTGSLAILSQADLLCNSLPGLSTWVPDFSSSFDSEDALDRQQFHEYYHAAGDIRMKIPTARRTTSHPSHLLRCVGFVFGFVAKIGSCSPSIWQTVPVDSQQLQHVIIKSWRELYPGTIESFCNLFDRSGGRSVGRVLGVDPYTATQLPAHALTHRQSEMRERFERAASNRRFLISNSGAPGLGPRDTREGDFLAVMVGGRVPYVLRKSDVADEQHPNLFSFVGERHVDGVMYGELFNHPEPPKLEEIWLE